MQDAQSAISGKWSPQRASKTLCASSGAPAFTSPSKNLKAKRRSYAMALRCRQKRTTSIIRTSAITTAPRPADRPAPERASTSISTTSPPIRRSTCLPSTLRACSMRQRRSGAACCRTRAGSITFCAARAWGAFRKSGLLRSRGAIIGRFSNTARRLGQSSRQATPSGSRSRGPSPCRSTRPGSSFVGCAPTFLSAAAAAEMGADLAGAVFEIGGEPPTEAKVRAITATGARCYPTYHFGECGRVGMGCAHPLDANDVHFFKDGLAIIDYNRRVPGFEIDVDAFCFTSLLPSTPKIMLNVELDDYGVIETRSCGCPLEAYGYTQHIREIRSFRKLTGEGVTLVGSEMLSILEEVLPARFGGSPLDYQLLEEEDERGFTKLSLVVSPRIAPSDEAAVIDAVLNALGPNAVEDSLTRVTWRKAEIFRVKRMEPIRTARGKLMPLDR